MYDKYHNNLKYQQKLFSVCIFSIIMKHYVKVDHSITVHLCIPATLAFE